MVDIVARPLHKLDPSAAKRTTKIGLHADCSGLCLQVAGSVQNPRYTGSCSMAAGPRWGYDHSRPYRWQLRAKRRLHMMRADRDDPIEFPGKIFCA
jgi:hypothetical protein